MKFQVMPELSPDEYQELKADIAKNGVVVPVLVDEDGNIIDGHNRVQIANELRIPYPEEVRDDLDDSGKRGLAFALNLNRRHLNRDQKRELIAKSLKADPQLSNREHARRTGASHPTVNDVRQEMEEDGRLEKFTSRTSGDGRERPSTQPERKPIADLPPSAPITPEEVTELAPEPPPEPERAPEPPRMVQVSPPQPMPTEEEVERQKQIEREVERLIWFMRGEPTARRMLTHPRREEILTALGPDKLVYLEIERTITWQH